MVFSLRVRPRWPHSPWDGAHVAFSTCQPKKSRKPSIVALRREGSTGDVADRSIEDRDAEVQFRVGDRQWRGDAEHAAHPAKRGDVHRQAELEAKPRDSGAEFGRGLLGPLVGDDLESNEQSAATHVTDALIAIAQLTEPGQKAGARLGRALRESLAQDDLDDLQPHRGREWVRDVRGVEE